jgi:hypothetical protein
MRPFVNALLHRPWQMLEDVDHLAREQAMRERDYARRRAAHPDPSDPDHPDELEEA